jgi:photosystem II stability/assembly factor-like uncharacterized protein
VTVGKVAAFPAGWRAVEDPGQADRIAPLAADPVTGELAHLSQPRSLVLAKEIPDLPMTAGLWLSGFLSISIHGPQQMGTGTGSTVDVSHDGGRTWHRTTFPVDFCAAVDMPGGPAIATADGKTAYAVGEAAGNLIIYRTSDGGLTWQRAAAQAQVGDRRLHAAVRADGTLIIQAGDQAGDRPVMYQSTDNAQTVQQIVLGPGASAVPVAGGYAQSNWPKTSGVWLSGDGTDWSYVDPPSLP